MKTKDMKICKFSTTSFILFTLVCCACINQKMLFWKNRVNIFNMFQHLKHQILIIVHIKYCKHILSMSLRTSVFVWMYSKYTNIWHYNNTQYWKFWQRFLKHDHEKGDTLLVLQASNIAWTTAMLRIYPW